MNQPIRTTFAAVLFSLFILDSSVASASWNPERRLGLGVQAGALVPLGNKEFKNRAKMGWDGGLWARYHSSAPLGFEFGYQRQDFGTVSTTADAFTLSAFWRFSEHEEFSPVLQVGLGASRVYNRAARQADTTRPTFQVRPGFEYAFAPDWSLGGHVDYRYTTKTRSGPGEIHSLSPMLSLTYYFQPCSEPKKDAKLESRPVATALQSAPDEDGDRVPDSEDRCPGTPRGVSVNALGCPEDRDISFNLNISFGSGSSKVQSIDDKTLGRLAEILKSNPKRKVQIEGHTDSFGLAKKNAALSDARAQAVKSLLIQRFHVSGSQVEAKGFGSKQPVATNDTAKGRAQNRRVAIRLSR